VKLEELIQDEVRRGQGRWTHTNRVQQRAVDQIEAQIGERTPKQERWTEKRSDLAASANAFEPGAAQED